MKRVLVVGGSSFAGRVLVEELLKAGGYEIHVPNRGAFPLGNEGVREHRCDRHDLGRLKETLPRLERDAAHGAGSEGGRIAEHIVRVHSDWQAEMFGKYPAFMSGARPLGSGGDASRGTSFQAYLRGELDSYSKRTLALLRDDTLDMLEKGLNMSEKVYEFLVKSLGYSSLDEAEKTLSLRRPV
jgi:hypothetical protein